MSEQLTAEQVGFLADTVSRGFHLAASVQEVLINSHRSIAAERDRLREELQELQSDNVFLQKEVAQFGNVLNAAGYFDHDGDVRNVAALRAERDTFREIAEALAHEVVCYFTEPERYECAFCMAWAPSREGVRHHLDCPARKLATLKETIELANQVSVSIPNRRSSMSNEQAQQSSPGRAPGEPVKGFRGIGDGNPANPDARTNVQDEVGTASVGRAPVAASSPSFAPGDPNAPAPQFAPELQHAFGSFGTGIALELIKKVAVMAEPHFLAFIQSLLDARKSGTAAKSASEVPYQ